MNIHSIKMAETPEGTANAQPKKLKPKWSRKRKVVTTILTLLVLIIGTAGYFSSRIIGDIDKVFHGNFFSDIEALFGSSQLKGQSSGRVNILVAGDSSDDPGHPGAVLTDSIMLLSIDTKNNTGFMLSIPRDLWVWVPGMNSYQKINAANDVTKFNVSGLPKGGMGQLQQIVQSDLGIPIDYYALVNYTAFKDAVNDVGGITININSPDSYGLYDSFTHIDLPNGNDSLNGQEALDLARARGDTGSGDSSYGFPDSDFTRTMYQREMVVAILKKSQSIGVLSNPVKVTSLFDALSGNVQTNLSVSNMIELTKLAKKVNLNKLGSYTYPNTLSGDSNAIIKSYYNQATDEDALIPIKGIGNYTQLQQYYDKLAGIRYHASTPLTPSNRGADASSYSSSTGSGTSDTGSYTATTR